MNKYNIIIALAALIWTGCGSRNDSTETTEKINESKFEDTKMEDAAEFAAEAAEGGMMEVQLGELAQSNATSPKVKEFGQMMVTEHTKANEELKELAQTKKIALPAMLGNEKMNKYNELRDKKGNDFDKAYIAFMIEDHEDDIELFRKESKEGQDPEIKAWAGGKLPTLEQHLMAAKETQKWVKE